MNQEMELVEAHEANLTFFTIYLVDTKTGNKTFVLGRNFLFYEYDKIEKFRLIFQNMVDAYNFSKY